MVQVVAKLDSCNTAVRLLKQSLHYEKRELQSVIMAEEEASTQLDKYTSRAGCQGFFLGEWRHLCVGLVGAHSRRCCLQTPTALRASY